MATRDQMAASIEPGSVPYGERGALEAGLPGPGRGGGGGNPGAASPGPLQEMPESPGSPIDMMLNGVFPSDPQVPQTAGLSVGDGPGPALAGTEESTYAARLRTVAEHAKSPQLRAQARAALKALWSQGRL